MPPMPQAKIWAMCIPNGSPTPIYRPSALPTCTRDFEARVTLSIGGASIIGMPPTPMPTFTCTGILTAVTACFYERYGPGDIPCRGFRFVLVPMATP